MTLEEMNWEQRFWVAWQALVEMESKLESHHVSPKRFQITKDHFKFFESKGQIINYKEKLKYMKRKARKTKQCTEQ